MPEISEQNRALIERVIEARASADYLLAPYAGVRTIVVADLNRLLDAARAEGAAEAAGWRPIESAPRDGTEVLLICDSAYTPTATVGWWLKGEGWYHYSVPAKGEKYAGGLTRWFPTHWMPLEAIPGPAKPTAEHGVPHGTAREYEKPQPNEGVREAVAEIVFDAIWDIEDTGSKMPEKLADCDCREWGGVYAACYRAADALLALQCQEHQTEQGVGGEVRLREALDEVSAHATKHFPSNDVSTLRAALMTCKAIAISGVHGASVHGSTREDYRCPKCGAAADERFDCCEVYALTALAHPQATGGDNGR